jgi:TRAP transporter 4TM/12TM fusion protein
MSRRVSTEGSMEKAKDKKAALAIDLSKASAIGRYENLPKPLKIIFLILTTSGLGLFIYQVFGFSIHDFVFIDFAYYYLLVGLFGSAAFLILPFRRGSTEGRVPWYDFVLAGLLFGICFYCYLHGWEIGYIGWSPPTVLQFSLALIFCLIAVEAARRMAGPVFIILCAAVGLYPLITDHMPGILWGYSPPFMDMIGSYVYGRQGLIGMPAEVVGGILIGFLLFAAVLLGSGAGQFFLSLALGVLGKFRGGPAKVAVVASGFFGSLSGSPYANIVATGSVTIPTMKRMGYPAHYAGAIEACASTGGVLMPPIMGSVAFVMCILLNVGYGYVIVCAFIPAVLYYLGLLMQVDGYAARVGLKGLPREEIPSIKKTLKEGWQFIIAIAFLVFGLLYMRWAELAPIYASGALFLLSFTRRETWMTPRRIVDVLATTGKMTSQMIAVLLPVGLILGGLSITGVAGAFAQGVVTLGGEAVVLLVAIAIVTTYLMGMIGMALIAYVVLAVTLAPALVQLLGIPDIAVHLFLVYYTMLGGLTAPVAPFAFIAAALSGAPPMKTALTCMRLGVVIYFIPIFFLFNPALILQGPIWETIYLFVMCVVGIIFLAGGLEGYLVKLGKVGVIERGLLIVGGCLIAFPEWRSTIIGTVLVALVIARILIMRRRTMPKPITSEY